MEAHKWESTKIERMKMETHGNRSIQNDIAQNGSTKEKNGVHKWEPAKIDNDKKTRVNK